MLHQRRAALDPVTVITIENAIDIAHLCMVDMTADNPIHAAPAGFARDRTFKLANKLYRVFHFVFQISGERPVRQPEPAPHQVEPMICRKRDVVCSVSKKGEPTGICHHPVKIIAVKD